MSVGSTNGGAPIITGVESCEGEVLPLNQSVSINDLKYYNETVLSIIYTFFLDLMILSFYVGASKFWSRAVDG